MQNLLMALNKLTDIEFMRRTERLTDLNLNDCPRRIIIDEIVYGRYSDVKFNMMLPQKDDLLEA